jgi:hypothetical protein
MAIIYGCKIFQMTKKFTNIFNSKALPKFTQFWTFWFENKSSGNPGVLLIYVAFFWAKRQNEFWDSVLTNRSGRLGPVENTAINQSARYAFLLKKNRKSFQIIQNGGAVRSFCDSVERISFGFATQIKHPNPNQGDLGPMLWFFKYFRRKIRRKNWRFWLKTKQNYPKFWS